MPGFKLMTTRPGFSPLYLLGIICNCVILLLYLIEQYRSTYKCLSLFEYITTLTTNRCIFYISRIKFRALCIWSCWLDPDRFNYICCRAGFDGSSRNCNNCQTTTSTDHVRCSSHCTPLLYSLTLSLSLSPIQSSFASTPILSLCLSLITLTHRVVKF